VATDYRSKGREGRRVEEGERGATKEEAIAAGRQTPTSLLTSLRLALYLDLEDGKVGHARDQRGGRRKTAPPRGSRPTPQTFRSSHLRPSRTASTTSGPPPSLDKAGTTPPLSHLDRSGPTRLQARRRLRSPLRPRPTSASHAQPGRNTPASEAVCFQGIAPLPTWIFNLVTRRPTQATRRRPQRSRQASA
jgi:hypothetical protein